MSERCPKCGHLPTYHGKTWCVYPAGSASKVQCDCDGWAVPPEGLDVERLTTAIVLHREQSSAKGQGCDHSCAPGISEMYARLSQQKEQGQ